MLEYKEEGRPSLPRPRLRYDPPLLELALLTFDRPEIPEEPEPKE